MAVGVTKGGERVVDLLALEGGILDDLQTAAPNVTSALMADDLDAISSNMSPDERKLMVIILSVLYGIIHTTSVAGLSQPPSTLVLMSDVPIEPLRMLFARANLHVDIVTFGMPVDGILVGAAAITIGQVRCWVVCLKAWCW